MPKTTPRKDDQLEIEIRIAMWNPRHNHDKAVTVFFEFLSGSVSLGTATIPSMAVHDCGCVSLPGTVRVVMSANQLKPDTTMKITLTAKDW